MPRMLQKPSVRLSMEEAAALQVRGRGAAPRDKPKGFLGKSQSTSTTYNLRSPSLQRSQALHNDHLGRLSLVPQGHGGHTSCNTTESPNIDELEESLRQLKVQVDSLASSLRSNPDLGGALAPESAAHLSPFSSRWPEAPAGSYEESGVGGPPSTMAESQWFLKPKHLLQPRGDYSALTSLGLPTAATSPVDQVAGLLGSKIAGWDSSTSVDLTFPLKLGAPHVIGVKSLLPPKIPVRACLPERASSPRDRGRSLSLGYSRSTRSQSFSPASKRTCWLRSRSQTPRPIWRPNSAKANACGQPPPRLTKPRGIRKKNESSRSSRARIYRPGTLAARSWTATRSVGRGTLSNSWSPYSLPSAAISSPTAQEINERFLRTLMEGAIGTSLIEMSPYQRELARLRLERLHVEEAWLLEQKRLQELERTRGPKPKWYEMRNSQFHYEAHKNNELLRNSQEVESVYNYRQKLAMASKEFQQLPNFTYLETH